MKLLLEILDIDVSHSCACMCSDMAIACACDGRDLYVALSGRFSFNDTSWAISTDVRVWKLFVMLITIDITSTCSRPLLCYCITCLSGAHIVWMLSMMSDVLSSVEVLHSMS